MFDENCASGVCLRITELNHYDSFQSLREKCISEGLFLIRDWNFSVVQGLGFGLRGLIDYGT